MLPAFARVTKTTLVSYLAALEKNRGVRPGSISHVMRAADVTAIIL